MSQSVLDEKIAQQAFRFWNPHKNAIECYFHPPIGIVKIGPGEYAPTPAHIKQYGLEASDFDQYVGPSFLSRTPPAKRRSLHEENGLPVPPQLARITDHLPRFQGAPNSAPRSTANVEAAKAAARRRTREGVGVQPRRAQSPQPVQRDNPSQPGQHTASQGALNLSEKIRAGNADQVQATNAEVNRALQEIADEKSSSYKGDKKEQSESDDE